MKFTVVSKRFRKCGTQSKGGKCRRPMWNINIKTITQDVMEIIPHGRFEVFTAVNMKNAVFWDVAPCGYCELSQRFGGTFASIFRVEKSASVEPVCSYLLTLVPRSRIFLP
jgi:hypothetical protein